MFEFMKNRKAQGAFEYILLIAGVLAIALIVVALLNTLGKSQGAQVNTAVGSYNSCILATGCVNDAGKYLCVNAKPAVNAQGVKQPVNGVPGACDACNTAFQNGKLSASAVAIPADCGVSVT